MIELAFYIAVAVVYLIDFALVLEHLKIKLFYRRYTAETRYEPYSLKPFDCSGCLTTWLTWIIGGVVYTTWMIIPIGFLAGIMALTLKKLIQ